MSNEKIIKSKDNSQIKILKKLSQKKYRENHGQFIVENSLIIKDALQDGYDFLSLFVSNDFKKRHQGQYEYLQKYSKSKNFYIIDQKINKHFSSLKTPSGICALYSITSKSLQEDKPVVYLNAINDPGNLGTIMRTMLAFGFNNLVLDENCADIYNAKTINASKDSIFKINIFHDKDMHWFKQNKLAVYVSDVHRGKNIDSFSPARNFCLVMGSESHGVDQKIKKIAKENIRIQVDKKIESLNVAIATTIFLYKFKQ